MLVFYLQQHFPAQPTIPRKKKKKVLQVITQISGQVWVPCFINWKLERLSIELSCLTCGYYCCFIEFSWLYQSPERFYFPCHWMFPPLHDVATSIMIFNELRQSISPYMKCCDHWSFQPGQFTLDSAEYWFQQGLSFSTIGSPQ